MEAALLPQYQHSEEIAQRFREAVLEGAPTIARAKWSEDVAVVDESEKNPDGFDYFCRNKQALEREFLSDLGEQIGVDQAKNFVSAVSAGWYFSPDSAASRRLKASVRGYLQYLGVPAESLDTIVASDVSEVRDRLPPSFNPLEVEQILETTHQVLYRHISEWNDVRPEPESQSRGTVFLRRGIALPQPYPKNHEYREWDFINGYSLTISVPERFSLSGDGHDIPAIITTDIDYLNHCILFFSPFIPCMPPDQLEAGVIPGIWPETIAFQGNRGGIYEYYLAPVTRPGDGRGRTDAGKAIPRPARRDVRAFANALEADELGPEQADED